MIAGSNDVVEDLLRAIPASSVITRHVGIEAMCNIEMHLDTDRAPVLLALYNQQGNCLSSCRVLAPDMPEMPPHIVTGHSTISVAKPYHKSKPEYTVPASAHVEAIHLDKQGPKPQSLATWLAEMPQEWCTYLLRQLTASQSGPGQPCCYCHVVLMLSLQHPYIAMQVCTNTHIFLDDAPCLQHIVKQI